MRHYRMCQLKMELFRKKMSHGLDFANAKSGKRTSKKETAVVSSNPCDIPEIALESCSMRLNPIVLVSRTSLVLFGRLHELVAKAAKVCRTWRLLFFYSLLFK